MDAAAAEELRLQARIDAAVAKAFEDAVTPTPTPAPTPTGTHVAPDPTPTETTGTPTPEPTPSPTATQASPPTPTEMTADPPNPYAAAAASVVRIETSSARGSGVMLGDSYHVVTNRHVIDGASDAELEVAHAFEGETPRVTRASVVYESANWDLALLRLNDSLGPPIKVARKLPSIGDSLVIGGFPGVGGDTLTVTTGTVAGFELGGLFIKVDAAIFPGNSGGAALDSNGRLVGIPTVIATDMGGALGFLISADLLQGDFTRALLNDLMSAEPMGDTSYVLSVLGVPAVVTVPEGWDIVSKMGYLDARQPGSDPRAVGSAYRTFGIFAIDLLQAETGNDLLSRLIEESSGAFELVNRNDIGLPSGFTDTILVKATERVDLSDFETRTSVLGSWIADSGLITRFVAGKANGQVVIAFIESSDLDTSRDADELLTRVRLLGS